MTKAVRLLLLLLRSKIMSRLDVRMKSAVRRRDSARLHNFSCRSTVSGQASVQSHDRLGRRGDMRDDSAEMLFLFSFFFFFPPLQKALVSSSGMARDVQSLILSIQHFLFRPRTKVPRRMVSERLSWHVTCPIHASFRFLTAARRGSCGPTRKLILLRIQSLVLCSKWRIRRSFLRHLVSKA